KQLAADLPDVPTYRQELAPLHYNLGNLLVGLRKPGEAEAEYRQALARYEPLTAEFPAEPKYRRELAMIHNNLGVLLKNAGQLGEAEAEYRSALALRR